MLEQMMEKLSLEMELETPLKPKLPGVYSIPLDEGYSISLTSTASDHFTLNSTLGTLPLVEKEAVFTQLLLANLLGQGTRGAVLGIDPEANLLTLTQDINYHLEYKEFRDLVEDFMNVADFWREEITVSQT